MSFEPLGYPAKIQMLEREIIHLKQLMKEREEKLIHAAFQNGYHEPKEWPNTVKIYESAGLEKLK